MITVKELKELLDGIDESATVRAYDGEVTAIIVENEDGETLLEIKTE